MNQLLLNAGDFLHGDFHAHVAPGDHDAVRHLEDVVDIVHALGIFDFGDDPDGMVAVLFQLLADLQHIVGPAGERGGDEVGLHFAGKGDVGPIPVAHKGHGQLRAGDVDPFVSRDHAAVDDGAGDGGGGGGLHLHIDEAVVNQNMAALAHVGGQAGKADGGDGAVPLHRFGGQGEGVPGAQFHLRFLEGAQADFRALGVDEDGDGEAQFLPQGLDHVDAGLVILMGLVGHVDARDVHAGKHQLPQHIRVISGGAQGADDFGLSHKQPPFFAGPIRLALHGRDKPTCF